MCGIHLSGLLTLRNPVRYEDSDLGTFNTYLASWTNGGHEFAFSIAQPVNYTKAPLLPHGTTADVDALLALHNRSLLLTATNVGGLYVATSGTLRAATRKLYQPVLTVTGKIARVHPPDVRFPGVKVVDLVVENGGLWPHRDTTLVAYFNREEYRLHMLAPLAVNMSLSLTGELSGWINGTLALDVLDVTFNNGGPLSADPLASLPHLFAKLDIISDFAAFSNQSELPPLAGRPSSFANVNSSALRWLETVAPLGTGEGSNAAVVRPSDGMAPSARARRNPSPSAGARVTVQTVRRRRDTPRPDGRVPFAPVDANIPEYETVSS